jgi:hypothetical protein
MPELWPEQILIALWLAALSVGEKWAPSGITMVQRRVALSFAGVLSPSLSSSALVVPAPLTPGRPEQSICRDLSRLIVNYHFLEPL